MRSSFRYSTKNSSRSSTWYFIRRSSRDYSRYSLKITSGFLPWILSGVLFLRFFSGIPSAVSQDILHGVPTGITWILPEILSQVPSEIPPGIHPGISPGVPSGTPSEVLSVFAFKELVRMQPWVINLFHEVLWRFHQKFFHRFYQEILLDFKGI